MFVSQLFVKLAIAGKALCFVFLFHVFAVAQAYHDPSLCSYADNSGLIFVGRFEGASAKGQKSSDEFNTMEFSGIRYLRKEAAKGPPGLLRRKSYEPLVPGETYLVFAYRSREPNHYEISGAFPTILVGDSAIKQKTRSKGEVPDLQIAFGDFFTGDLSYPGRLNVSIMEGGRMYSLSEQNSLCQYRQFHFLERGRECHWGK